MSVYPRQCESQGSDHRLAREGAVCIMLGCKLLKDGVCSVWLQELDSLGFSIGLGSLGTRSCAQYGPLGCVCEPHEVLPCLNELLCDDAERGE